MISLPESLRDDAVEYQDRNGGRLSITQRSYYKSGSVNGREALNDRTLTSSLYTFALYLNDYLQLPKIWNSSTSIDLGLLARHSIPSE